MLFISPPFGNYLNFKDAISIKGSFTLDPRPGLLWRIFSTLRYDSKEGGWVNKIGLRNRGIDYAVARYGHAAGVWGACGKGARSVVSIAILESAEIAQFNTRIPADMNLELNVSCPNIDFKEKNKINAELHQFLNDEREWCVVKLAPTVERELVDQYYAQGFRQFHCSNTIPLADGRGGLSGPKVREANRELIPYIRGKYSDLTIIGGGGIRTGADVAAYTAWGANHYSCSTALFNPIGFYKLYKSVFCRGGGVACGRGID